jgi:PleD family two-component response regulator
MDMEHEGSPLKVTASFGVTATSLFRGRWCTGEAMLAAADDALYEAKQIGRDCVCVCARLRQAA